MHLRSRPLNVYYCHYCNSNNFIKLVETSLLEVVNGTKFNSKLYNPIEESNQEILIPQEEQKTI